jgi:predicted MPP superfamily phosphohydrolase
MRMSRIIVFLTVVFTVYFFTNFYIFIKGYKALPWAADHKFRYALIFFTLATLFIAGKILERSHSSVISDVLNISGGIWLAFMLYCFIFLLLSDILFLILKVTHITGGHYSAMYHKWSFIVTVTVSFLLIAGGFINRLFPVITKYDISVNKDAGEIRNLRIAAVSDIHLGSVIRKRSMKKLSRMIGNTDPDIVLLLGDVVDGEIGPVLRDDLLSWFSCPKCRYGLLAITGNHEFIGGAYRTIPYIESKGIRILKDEKVILPGGIQIIGRIDRDSRMFRGMERKKLGELMKDVDINKPVILLDHQPFDLGDTEKYGVDLQLSGHTHNGQIWPLNYLTGMIYEVSSGYKKKGSSHIIVSSGYGLWGPPIRSGSRSEILLVNISFAGDK